MLDLDSRKARSFVDYKSARIFMVKYDYKNKVIKARIENFTGYATLMLVKVKDNQVANVNFNVLEGKCALAYKQKKDFHVIAKSSIDSEVQLISQKGFIRFRVIGEKTNVEISIKLKERLESLDY